MADATFMGENVEIIQANTGTRRTVFSWGAAIAGAFGAVAVGFLIIALGSGIGLLGASPYSWGPSLKTLTIAGAIWLLMAHTFGFAVGGYMAARLREPAYDGMADETRFRDGAQGFLAWAIAVVFMFAIAGLAALYAAGATAQVAAGAAASTDAAMSNPQNANATAEMTGYFVDMLFRPGPAGGPQMSQAPGGTVGAAPAGPGAAGAVGNAQQRLDAESRAEVTRIVARGISQGGLSDQDRTYLAQLVSQRTGIGQDEAQRRVSDVENKAKETAKDTADKAAKAGAYLSFWMFMALLFGATAATLAGIEGGSLRDRDSFGRRAAAVG